MRDVPDDEVHLHVRMPKARRDAIDDDAKDTAENRSEWVNRVIETELRRKKGMTPGRTVRVETGGQVPRMRSLQPVGLCNHPAQLRSEPHPVSGETRCMACGATVSPLR